MTESHGGLKRGSLPVLAVICAMAVLGLGSSVASANSILVGLTPVVAPDGADWKWTYAATLAGTDSTIQPGDGFTIYDFAGLVPLTLFTPSVDWIATTTSGTSGDGDDFGPFGLLSGTPNITFTWDGDDPIVVLGFLGNFGANSTFSGRIVGDYGANDHGEEALDQTNSGHTEVPVPEPGTLVMLGTGLMGAAIVARKRRST